MRGLRQFFLATALIAVSVVPGVTQEREQTLADIRQELTVLHVEVQRLNRELSTTGAPSASLAGTSVLDRVTAIEAEGNGLRPARNGTSETGRNTAKRATKTVYRAPKAAK